MPSLSRDAPVFRWLPCFVFFFLGSSDADNLVLGRPPYGSSHVYGADFALATDGHLGTEWRSQTGDYPGHLLVDLGAPCRVAGMRVSGGSKPDGGFRTLKTYHSVDGLSWSLVRRETNAVHCSGGTTSDHAGWTEETRFVLIQMEDRCSGLHFGSVGLAEWQVLGSAVEDMEHRFEKSWPHCSNLGLCFSFVDLDLAKEQCLQAADCDGFSFSVGLVEGGRGSGCYKTACGGSNTSSLGRGSHGYWEKRRSAPLPWQLADPSVVRLDWLKK
ncbi:unnamed protein product [Polarella glacialis]|uniref:F5/8 type C domain-containing protein n=1 Tax=Polarella glacialis TaxID=89957 RepID=A0A813D3G8_POLGL|nr:unnamed protein product [Polarella glacialis]